MCGNYNTGIEVRDITFPDYDTDCRMKRQHILSSKRA